jgi:hypothetical protein
LEFACSRRIAPNQHTSVPTTKMFGNDDGADKDEQLGMVEISVNQQKG